MTKLWRPEGWKTEEVKENPLHCFAPQVCADHFFEAGADAMLEKLRKGGVCDIIKYTDNAVIIRLGDIVNPYKLGTWVFIPEEEE